MTVHYARADGTNAVYVIAKSKLTPLFDAL
jgi:hypothetical protein